MVFANKYSNILISKFTNFRDSNYLKDQIRIFGNEISACAVLTALTYYVVDVLAIHSEIPEEEKLIYQFIDNHMETYPNASENSDEHEFDGAICTCFLENLLNRDSSGRYNFNRILPYLNSHSREYCKYWDSFTGVRTPGLWNDDEWSETNK